MEMEKITQTWQILTPNPISRLKKTEPTYQANPALRPAFREAVQELRKRQGFSPQEYATVLKPLRSLWPEYQKLAKTYGVLRPKTLSALNATEGDDKAKKEYQEYKRLLELAFDERRKISQWIDQHIDKTDVENLLKDFNLSKSWFLPVKIYVLTDTMAKPHFSLRIHLIDDPQDIDRNQVRIELLGHTTIRDLWENWPRIRATKSFLPRSNKKTPKLSIDGKTLFMEIFRKTGQREIRKVWGRVEPFQKRLSGALHKGARGLKGFENILKVASSREETYDLVDDIFGESFGPEDKKRADLIRKYRYKAKKRGWS